MSPTAQLTERRATNETAIKVKPRIHRRMRQNTGLGEKIFCSAHWAFSAVKIQP